MQIGICSYSFHRSLALGQQDIFKFITDCKELGCTQLDPWNGHLPLIRANDATVKSGIDPEHPLSGEEEVYVSHIKRAGDAAGLPFGCIAADRAHIYEASPEARAENRGRAYRWLHIAAALGATQMRIDPGGLEEMSAEMFGIIKEGYRDLIERAKSRGVQILVENHWGASFIADNLIKLLENIDGLGFLHDLHNWKPKERDESRRRLAAYASATHVKTFSFDAYGNESSDEDVPTGVRIMLDAGFKGPWGVESTPLDGDEYGAARKTIALLRKLVAFEHSKT